MKIRKLFWIGVFLLPLIACNKPDDISETAATIVLEVPLTSSELNINLKSSYIFSGYATFCLGKSENVKNCPTNILSVKPGSAAMLTIPLPPDIINISHLMLSWGRTDENTNNFVMHEPVNIMTSQAEIKDEKLLLNLDNVLKPLINNVSLFPYGRYKMEITGNTEFNLASKAKIEVPLIIEHENLSVRFTVF